MSLIGNKSVLHKSPLRFVNGREALLRSNFNKHGMMRNTYAYFDDKAARPYGHLSPSAWILPKKAGGISSVNNSDFTISASGSGAMGLNAIGSTSFTITIADAQGDLVVSGAGTAEFTISATANAVATLNGDGTASMTFSATAGATALAWGASLSSFTISGTLTPYAVGHMEGTTEEAGLSNAGIANSVWAKVIEAGYSAEGIMRLLAAHAAGSATGLEGADPQFVGLDGVTTRINGTYSAGTRTIDTLDAE